MGVRISGLQKVKKVERRRLLTPSPRRNGIKSRLHLSSKTELLDKPWSPDRPVLSSLLTVFEDESTKSIKLTSMVTNQPTCRCHHYRWIQTSSFLRCIHQATTESSQEDDLCSKHPDQSYPKEDDGHHAP